MDVKTSSSLSTKMFVSIVDSRHETCLALLLIIRDEILKQNVFLFLPEIKMLNANLISLCLSEKQIDLMDIFYN